MSVSPVVRISIGLVLLSSSILLISDLTGLAPHPNSEAIEARRTFCESLAVMVSVDRQVDEMAAVQEMMQVLVARNDDIRSMALRADNGKIIVATKAHADFWQGASGLESSPTHWRVPIVRRDAHWGTLEVRYNELSGLYAFGLPVSPVVRLLLFVALAGFIVYQFFIRKTLQNLDPSSVIPKQVQATLDVLAEGVAIFDRDMRIVLANSAFGKSVGQPIASLLGKRASELGFSKIDDDGAAFSFPWEAALADGKICTGVKLTRANSSVGNLTFIVNGAPVFDDTGAVKGALATFDDMTELEEKNIQLQKMLNLLKRSRDEVSRQNEQLQILATRDPLTGCFNRRAFFAAFDPIFDAAALSRKELVCVMTDIDHFKSFNDRYGHSVGDNVIKRVASCLQSTLREQDILCRYGGEEFCIILPTLEIAAGMKVADRIRRMIESQNEDELEVTCSFGVSSITGGANSTAELIDQADKALYVAKKQGRNVVVQWHDKIDVEQVSTEFSAQPILQLVRSNPPEAMPARLVVTNEADTEGSDSEHESGQIIHHVSVLEEDNRWFTEALEILASMNNLYGDAAVKSDEHRIYNAARKHVTRLMTFEATCFYSFAAETQAFAPVCCEPDDIGGQIQKQVKILINTGELAWAAQQNHPVEYIDSEQRQYLLHALTTEEGPTGIFVGLMAGVGVALDYTACNLLSIILNNTAGALVSARLYKRLNQQKHNLECTLAERTQEVQHNLVHDGLTGLPNRMLFRDRIESAIRRAARFDQSAGVLLLDLDRFKRVNKLLGQTAGDDLIKEVAARITSVLRASDSVARLGAGQGTSLISRLGGDEFGILLTDINHVKGVSIVVERLMQALSEPFHFGAREIHVTVSVGVSLYPSDGTSAEVLLRQSESAMYIAKQFNDNKCQFYSDDRNVDGVRHLDLEDQMRQAIKNDEFELHYQPKVDLNTGNITGLEALIRWKQPTVGYISPAEFIPVAESCGLIGPIGAWVLRTACTQAQQWFDEGFVDTHVAVNLSAVQLGETGIFNQIMTILHDTELPPQVLQLEITESAIMQNIDKAAGILQKFSDAGISIAIDDFGTGYSSLSHLKRLPVDLLKIDGSFVHDVVADGDDAAIVTAIIAMAHSMGMETVAECVESLEQTAFLQDVGCDQLQGYIYSPPLPAAKATAKLRQEATAPVVQWIAAARRANQ